MPTPLEQFAQFLRDKGQRLTPEREIVVLIALSIDTPFDADRVIEAILSTTVPCRVSRSTVYRTLTSLEECGLIHRNPGGEGYIRSLTHVGEPLSVAADCLGDDAGVMSSEACTRAHGNLIAGTCPWCNRGIINGVVEER